MSRRPHQPRPSGTATPDDPGAAEAGLDEAADRDRQGTSPEAEPTARRRRSGGGRSRTGTAWADAADQERGGLLVVDEDGRPFAIAPPAVATGLRRFVGRAVGGNDDELPRRIAVTAALAGEGVTFVTRALGAVLAHDLRAHVCIVETNWWRSTRGKAKAALPDDRAGLADVVRGDVGIDGVLQPTSDPMLAWVPAGAPAVRERPILARAPAFGSTLHTLSEKFDYVLIDLPPVSAVAEALPMAQHAEGFLLVVQHGATTEGQVRATLQTLDVVPHLGVVLNRSNPRVPRRLLRSLAPR